MDLQYNSSYLPSITGAFTNINATQKILKAVFEIISASIQTHIWNVYIPFRIRSKAHCTGGRYPYMKWLHWNTLEKNNKHALLVWYSYLINCLRVGFEICLCIGKRSVCFTCVLLRVCATCFLREALILSTLPYLITEHYWHGGAATAYGAI